jgi:uncharacterized protein
VFMNNSEGMGSDTDNTARMVVCPACAKDSLYGPQNRFRPFCSERCKNHDFGAWASEAFRMSTVSPPDDQILGDSRYQ